MGVINVPLAPAVSVIIATIAGLAPNGLIISGASTPVAMTGNAANEFSHNNREHRHPQAVCQYKQEQTVLWNNMGNSSRDQLSDFCRRKKPQPSEASS